MYKDCCASAQDHASHSAALDPTLSSCCQRDQQQQKKNAEIREQLLAADRIDQRVRLAKSAVHFSPTEPEPDALKEDEGKTDDEGNLIVCRKLCPGAACSTLERRWYIQSDEGFS